MPLTQVPPALLTSTTGTGTTVALSASPTFTGTVTTPGVTFSDSSLQTAAASPYVLKNRIINGSMLINQRGTQTGIGASSGYGVDRWLLGRESGSQAARFTLANQALTTSDLPFTQDGQTYCQKISTTTASGGISASYSNYITQRIEGFNIADVGYGTANAKTLTLSFWAKTDGQTGVMSVSFYATSNRNYIQSVNITNAWQKFTLSFPGDTAGGTLTADNSSQLQVMFVLSAGSNFYATANQWNSGYANAVSTQADLTNSTSNALYLTGVQLEIGTSATPFERRLYNQELANCQRYFVKTDVLGNGVAVNGSNVTLLSQMPVTMRANPSVSVGGTNWQISDDYSADANTSSPTIVALYEVSPTSIRIQLGGFTGLSTGRFYNWRPSTTSLLSVSAEL
jgi:hypothetical protein